MENIILTHYKEWYNLEKYIELFHIIFTEVKNKEYERLLTIPKNLSQSVLEIAQENKRSDIYHSTAIEGYDITPEQVNRYLGYDVKRITTEERTQLENILVVKGYSVAFDYLLSSYNEVLDEEYLKDLYQNLWSESFKLNDLLPYEQRSYRTTVKFMRGAHGYSMPESYQIPYLINILVENLEQLNHNAFLKAIVWHFLLAPIQPFEDGNGRVSRFIMNKLFLQNGFYYLTITQHNYRQVYLSQYGLDQEKLLETFRSFVQFIEESYKKSTLSC